MENNLVLSEKNLGKCVYTLDNLGSDVQIEIKHINNVDVEIKFDDSEQYKDGYIVKTFKPLNTYKLVLEDLKNQKIRNYNTAEYTKVVVTTTQSNLNRLQRNDENLNGKSSSNSNNNNNNSNSNTVKPPASGGDDINF